MDQFRISATGSGPNYLPEYVSRELGFFEDVGIAVTSWVPNPWTGALDDIDAGAAEAALGGLWVPAMYYRRVRDYVAFAQLNARFPMALVTRGPVPQPLDWHVLEGKVVLVPGSGGVAPYQFLAGVLREAGVDTSRVTFVHDLSGPMLSAMFRGGTGDALLVDGLSAATLLSMGVGQSTIRMDEVCDPYTLAEIRVRVVLAACQVGSGKSSAQGSGLIGSGKRPACPLDQLPLTPQAPDTTRTKCLVSAALPRVAATCLAGSTRLSATPKI